MVCATTVATHFKVKLDSCHALSKCVATVSSILIKQILLQKKIISLLNIEFFNKDLI